MRFLLTGSVDGRMMITKSLVATLALGVSLGACSKNQGQQVEFVKKKGPRQAAAEERTSERSEREAPDDRIDERRDSPAADQATRSTDPDASVRGTNGSSGTSNPSTTDGSDLRGTRPSNGQSGQDASASSSSSQGTTGGGSTTAGTTGGSTTGTSANNNGSEGSASSTGVSYKPYQGDPSADIQKWVAADRQRRGSAAQNYRYAYIPTSFLADKAQANYARVGLSKALNSVAIAAKDIYNPEDVSEGHGIVFGFDITKYWGNSAAQKWGIIAGARVKRIFAAAPNLDVRRFDANAPVSADRLAYNMLHGGIYNALIDTERNGGIQKRKIQAGKVTHTMAIKNAITIGPRYAQRREMPDGRAYWESFDQFFGRRGQEVPYIAQNRLPTFRGDGMLADFGVVASESWNHMENGMLAYYIWGNANQERTKAEQAFVIDPLNHKGGDLLNGFCVFCHISGVQAAASDVPKAIEEGRVQGQHAERLKSYFTSQEDLSAVYAKDRKIFTDAMAKIVNGMSDGDKVYNEGLISGADAKEPAYFLVSKLTGSRLDGTVRGNDTRDALANRRGGGGGGNRGGGGGGGGGGW